jgi:hypothetical protein
MTKDYNKPASAATLTQQELFGRFLDAPLQIRSASALLGQREEVDLPTALTAEQCFYDYIACCVSLCVEQELPQNILEALREADNPYYSLETAIEEFDALIRGLATLRIEFERLMGATHIGPPEDDAPESEFEEWAANPRYVLPVIESMGEAA